MPPPTCLSCLKRSLISAESGSSIDRAAFSTTAARLVNPPKKKSVKGAPTTRTGSSLRLARNTRVTNAKPPAPGERKALRKRVVLSNTNALEVQGLQDFTPANVAPDQLKALQGKVLGLDNDTVEALRASEAFKPTQGWSLFRRPATLVRQETIDVAERLHRAADTDPKSVERMVIFGERYSGKSVLSLQAMAMAHLKGWLVLHFPEAKDMTIAHSAFQPERTADGHIIYVQPTYTAQVLANFVKANRPLLDTLQISQEHKLPMPVQSNMSLARFAELGADDTALAWPIWRALMVELTTPSQPDQEAFHRPPVLVSLDGVDHVMRQSAYLDAEAKPVHAHELALVRDFMSMLTGETAFPNGGMILASTSASSRPAVPTLDHFLAANEAEKHVSWLLDFRNDLRDAVQTAHSNGVGPADIDFGDLREKQASTLPRHLLRSYDGIIRSTRTLREDGDYEAFLATLERYQPRVPQWDPYVAIDQRVADVMSRVGVQEVQGLSKAEARGVMEYYAQSGMMRGSVTEGLVSERWTMAGSGIIGQLERATVTQKFM